VPSEARALPLQPDVRLNGAAMKAIKWLHRRTGETEIYFLSNQTESPQAFTADFRVNGLQPEVWDPESGSITAVPAYRNDDGRTQIELALPAIGSTFVVFRHAAEPQHLLAISSPKGPAHLNADVRVTAAGLEFLAPGIYQVKGSRGAPHDMPVGRLPSSLVMRGPWQVDFAPAVGRPFSRELAYLKSWIDEADETVKYFSGTATYRATLVVPADALGSDVRAELDLGNVGDLASVRINGRPAGSRWTFPFAVDATSLLHAGENTIEIAVTNAWANRMIGDERLPEDVAWEKKGGRPTLTKFPDWYDDPAKIQWRQRVTFASSHLYEANSPLLPGGLMGPVSVRFSRVVPLAASR